MAFELVEKDTGSTLRVEHQNSATKAAINLTGKTISLRYIITPGGTLQTKSMAIQSPATDGKSTYLFLAGELTPGHLKFDTTITDSEGLTISSLESPQVPIKTRVA